MLSRDHNILWLPESNGYPTKLDIEGTGTDNNGTTAPLRIISGNGAQRMLIDGNDIDALADGLFLNNNTDQDVVLARGGGRVIVPVLEITGGNDLAEPFDIAESESLKPGTLVSIDPERPGQLRVARKAYDRTVAGVVSGANGLSPGITLTKEGSVADGTSWHCPAACIVGAMPPMVRLGYALDSRSPKV